MRNGWFSGHHTPVFQVPVQTPGHNGNQEYAYVLSDSSFLLNNPPQQYCDSLIHMDLGIQESPEDA